MRVRGQCGVPHRGICASDPVKMKWMRKAGNKRLGIKAQLPEIPSSVKCSVVKRKPFIKSDDLPDIGA